MNALAGKNPFRGFLSLTREHQDCGPATQPARSKTLWAHNRQKQFHSELPCRGSSEFLCPVDIVSLRVPTLFLQGLRFPGADLQATADRRQLDWTQHRFQ